MKNININENIKIRKDKDLILLFQKCPWKDWDTSEIQSIRISIEDLKKIMAESIEKAGRLKNERIKMS